jgi:hypothetical protein
VVRCVRPSEWLYLQAAVLFEFCTGAFSSEVDTGSREENASNQESRASVLIQSEPIML